MPFHQLTLPNSRAVTLADGQTHLNVTNSLRVLPGFSGDVTVGLKYPSDAPIYWQLPPEFLGDKVCPEMAVGWRKTE